jgi:arylsulfatase A-like enzyme
MEDAQVINRSRLRCHVRLAFGLVVAICAFHAGPSVSHAAEHPNVVVLLADDAGWGDYSRNGNNQVATPQIDSLAAQGVTLNRFYVCPLCAPTRAEFLTGRYYPRTGVYGVSTGQERLSLNEKTIADAFHAAGYATGAFGKWHNGSQWPYHPLARGFDEYFGHTSGHWGEYFDPPLEHNGQPVRGKGYIVDVCTDQALDFIERHRDQPFFCYIPFTTPHSPWAVPDEDWQRFRDKPILQTATDPQRENVAETRCALAMLENQDRNVGRVLRKLEELQLVDNTIVVYFSDNGPNSWRWNGGMKGIKGTIDEGGVRSTCFWRWPTHLPAGTVVDQIAGAVDLLPTLTALASVAPVGVKALDGRDISSLLRGGPQAETDRRIFSTWGGQVSVRTQQFRLDGKGRLFDMQADPGQATPVNELHAQLARDLQTAADAWKDEVFAEAASEWPPGFDRRVAKNTVDPRPFTVGYRELPRTWLPARDGVAQGGVRRSAAAPNCSYFVNWTRTEEALIWNIDVHTAGKYEVEILYTCAEADVGSTIELSFREHRLTGKVEPAWDPPLYTNQDTLPRPDGESQMKEFRSLALGSIELEAGTGPLTLRALEIPGREVMQVRAVTLTLVDK